jgi:hypothetical protein
VSVAGPRPGEPPIIITAWCLTKPYEISRVPGGVK